MSSARAWRRRGCCVVQEVRYRNLVVCPGPHDRNVSGRGESVVDAGHEIAHHGWTHRPPASLTKEKEEEELVRGNEAIRRISGAVRARLPFAVVGSQPVFRRPHARARIQVRQQHDGRRLHAVLRRNGDVIELKSAARFGKHTGLVEMPIHWSTDDSPHFEYVRRSTACARDCRTRKRLRELDHRFPVHAEDGAGVGRAYLHVPSVHHRPRASSDDAGASDTRMKDEGAVFQRVDQTVEEFRHASAGS